MNGHINPLNHDDNWAKNGYPIWVHSPISLKYIIWGIYVLIDTPNHILLKYKCPIKQMDKVCLLQSTLLYIYAQLCYLANRLSLFSYANYLVSNSFYKISIVLFIHLRNNRNSQNKTKQANKELVFYAVLNVQHSM